MTTLLLRPVVADRSWTVDAVCARRDVPADLWSADNETARAVAQHVCRSHCPVMAECAAEAQLCAGTPDRYRSMVVGGVVYDASGKSRPRRTQPARCGLCTHDPWQWPDILSMSNGRGIPERELAPCGSEAGYSRHRRSRERACGPCREAHNDYTSRYKRRERSRKAATS